MNTNKDWLDIASAPKDFSTEFDGWNGERVPNVIWAHPEYELKGEYAWCRSVYEPHHGWSMERVKGLTHWMPLPAAPGSPASTVATEGEKDERQAVDVDSFDDPSALAAVADALSYDTSNDNAQFAAAYLYRQAKALTEAPAAGDALAVEDQQYLHWMIAEECRIETLTLGNGTRYRVHWPDVDEYQAEWFFSPGGAIRAAIAQQKGEA